MSHVLIITIDSKKYSKWWIIFYSATDAFEIVLTIQWNVLSSITMVTSYYRRNQTTLAYSSAKSKAPLCINWWSKKYLEIWPFMTSKQCVELKKMTTQPAMEMFYLRFLPFFCHIWWYVSLCQDDFSNNFYFIFTAMECGDELSKMDIGRSIFQFSKNENMDRSILLLYDIITYPTYILFTILFPNLIYRWHSCSITTSAIFQHYRVRWR